MSKPQEIWQFILDKKQQQLPVMLLYVVESKGSSPGRQGFFMAVSSDGLMKGSIGGGIMEHKLVELAKRRLEEQVDESSLFNQVHDKSAKKNKSGMICSGEQTIFMYTITSDDLHILEMIIDSLTQQVNGCLQLCPQGISFSNLSPQQDVVFNFANEGAWTYQEKTGFKNRLHIVGGGHCALAFSRIMRMMDFRISLYEDRQSLNTFEANEFVHEKFLLGDYSELGEHISSAADAYVVVMTFGYRTDETALRALLNKDFAYLGLLGSASKIRKMFDGLRKDGVSERDLSKIFAPVGLPINSQTPEEIAISIASEIVQVKNKNSKQELLGSPTNKRIEQ